MDSGVFYMAVLLRTLLLKLPGGAEIPSQKGCSPQDPFLSAFGSCIQTLGAGFLIGDSSLYTQYLEQNLCDSPTPYPYRCWLRMGGEEEMTAKVSRGKPRAEGLPEVLVPPIDQCVYEGSQ